jgi:hypothetical protein
MGSQLRIVIRWCLLAVASLPRARYNIIISTFYHLPAINPVISKYLPRSVSTLTIMASATGIPEQDPTTTAGEDEPLLGRPGDASQTTDGLQYNLVLGW